MSNKGRKRVMRKGAHVAAVGAACGLLGLPGCSSRRPVQAAPLRQVATSHDADAGPPGAATPSRDDVPKGAGSTAPQTSGPPDVTRRFLAHRAEHPDLTYQGLERELGLALPPDAPLSFDPNKVRYALEVANKLSLTAQERATFRSTGVVNVDHDQRYSMAAAYFGIFTRDLPVLVTTDSVLHALHRSYDAIIQELEASSFTDTVNAALRESHLALLRHADALRKAPLAASAADVDVYLTVARNLLTEEPTEGKGVAVHSLLGNDDKVGELLAKIALLKMDRFDAPTLIYGGARPIDYSQFRPRGHYTASESLSRYFRTVMWLGRADTGFVIAPPDPQARIVADSDRELRSAALLAQVLRDSQQLDRFAKMGEVVDFLVGRSDNLTPLALLGALAGEKMLEPKALEDATALERLRRNVVERGAQQIRSQVVLSDPERPDETKAPVLFQLFGQRFLLDSYVLSRVVYDSIVYQGAKQLRGMPSGLDVMGALGNDEAVRLSKPELERWNYSTELLAARKTVDDQGAEEPRKNVYETWLDALRTLDDVPKQGLFPQVMRGTGWRRKQLQTQLASWAELRHDTVLYGKESYSAGIMCEYPTGYVEPYPELFAHLAFLADEARGRLAAAAMGGLGFLPFFTNFRDTMLYLEHLARSELAAKPFTAEESGFLKKTIDARGIGCGPPTYDGWYARLFYGGSPEAWKPTVSDVHTDPTSSQVLQEGVGDANFIVVAVDNRNDRAAYVGPVYSYYEFTRNVDARMTDEEWRSQLEASKAPARPTWWTAAFPAPRLKRDLGALGKRAEIDPRALAAERVREALGKADDQAEKLRLLKEVVELERRAGTPPTPAAGAGDRSGATP